MKFDLKKFSQFISFFIHRILQSNYLPALLIFIGIFARCSQYIFQQSIWLDEAWLARDVAGRSFKEIFFNILSNKELPAIPPIGFLLIEKTFINILGNNELSLRLFPFLAGSASIILFWIFVKRNLDRLPAILALGFFVFTESLIYYSAECKQYGGEVLVAILLYLSFYYFFNRTSRISYIAIFGLIGVAAMFISHTAVLILGAIGLTHLIFLKDKIFEGKNGYFFSYVFWGACFILFYFFYLNPMFKQDARMGKFVMQSTMSHFMPKPDLTFEFVRWFWWSLNEYFKNVVYLTPAFLAIVIWLIGCISVWKKDKVKFFLLFIPLMLVLVASGLKKFPFVGRFVLFLLPATIIFISEGFAVLMRKNKIISAIAISIFFIFITPAVINTVKNIISPRQHEEIRPLMAFLKDHQLEGDILYLNNSAQFAYLYYLPYLNFKFTLPILGYFDDEIVQRSPVENSFIPFWFSTNSPYGILYVSSEVRVKSEFQPEYQSNQYPKRVWLLLSHITKDGSDQFIKQCFDARGKMLLEKKAYGAWLYLYELDQPISTIQQAKKVFKLP